MTIFCYQYTVIELIPESNQKKQLQNLLISDFVLSIVKSCLPLFKIVYSFRGSSVKSKDYFDFPKIYIKVPTSAISTS